jgi:hypothetical protein
MAKPRKHPRYFGHARTLENFANSVSWLAVLAVFGERVSVLILRVRPRKTRKN